jgi:hypothetical protein
LITIEVLIRGDSDPEVLHLTQIDILREPDYLAIVRWAGLWVEEVLTFDHVETRIVAEVD